MTKDFSKNVTQLHDPRTQVFTSEEHVLGLAQAMVSVEWYAERQQEAPKMRVVGLGSLRQLDTQNSGSLLKVSGSVPEVTQENVTKLPSGSARQNKSGKG